MIGEGGNLGFSQRGRIEYAMAGGRVNTDFIDNSGGVNCSDVEVNLKILFAPLMESGRLKRPARNRLLGDNAMGSGYAFQLHTHLGAGAYGSTNAVTMIAFEDEAPLEALMLRLNLLGLVASLITLPAGVTVTVLAKSAARLPLVKPTTACFAATYAAMKRSPSSPASEATLTMRPQRRSTMAGYMA